MQDVIVIGGGVAGLSAALILGRGLRRVTVCDGDQPRNAASRASHGFLTRDGIDPAEFRRLAREDLRRYDTVQLLPKQILQAEPAEGGFTATLQDGTALTARKLLLATGVVDQLPPAEGASALFGRGVFHCPYCDGWEMRGQPLAVYGQGKKGVAVALELTHWSREVVLCTDGPAQHTSRQRTRLSRNGVRVYEQKLTRLEERDGWLDRICLADGTELPVRALFFSPSWEQRSPLPERLGCKLDDQGAVHVRGDGATTVPGVFAAGDLTGGLQFAVLAASDGARVAVAINAKLIREDLACREKQPQPKPSRPPRGG